MTESRNDIHNANIVRDVAEAGGCGLKNLQSGATCGLVSGHKGPCDFLTPSDVPGALAANGIDLESNR
jgi:hypothetical protein